MDQPREQTVFSLSNYAAMPLWLAMILAPRSAFTRRVMAMSDPILLGLSVAYVTHLSKVLDTFREVGKAAAWRGALSQPSGFLAGWTHFVAFDLFVGRWIWRTALEEGRSPRLALLLTWMAGPSGLGLFAAQRRLLRTG